MKVICHYRNSCIKQLLRVTTELSSFPSENEQLLYLHLPAVIVNFQDTEIK
jgi:hypothetical protein